MGFKKYVENKDWKHGKLAEYLFQELKADMPILKKTPREIGMPNCFEMPKRLRKDPQHAFTTGLSKTLERMDQEFKFKDNSNLICLVKPVKDEAVKLLDRLEARDADLFWKINHTGNDFGAIYHDV